MTNPATLRLIAVKAQSLRWWAHEAMETVYAQTCHDPELIPSWVPELTAAIKEFDAVNNESEQKEPAPDYRALLQELAEALDEQGKIPALAASKSVLRQSSERVKAARVAAHRALMP